MRFLSFSISFCILCTVFPSDAYRILGLMAYNGRSHFLMFEQLMKGLAERGHQVDVVGHFPLKKSFPNYHDIIDLSTLNDKVSGRQNNITWDVVRNLYMSKSLAHPIATQAGSDLCHLMNHPKFKELVKNPEKNPPYDLIIAEIFGANCYLALGQHFNVPVVGIVTSAMWPWVNDIIANPEEPAFVPHVLSGFDGEMNFWQRIENTIDILTEKLKFNYYTADQDDIIKKFLGPNAPSVRDAERNVSLILVNSYFSLNGVRPFTTAVVEVGGLHIPKTTEALPKEIQEWLDESKDGFLYISFGSMFKIESFPKETLFKMYASIEKLAPIRVLMKIANPKELPPGLPNNVLTQSWLTQLAVLQHKHLRGFMTHGGLMGTQEAVYYGVPMIGVPLFADQGQNIEIYVRKNVAVSLKLDRLTEENMDAAFNAILRDPSYMKAAKKLSAQFRDRPLSALDTAIFWVEYVIRHGGMNLRSPAMDLTWWQISLLDVYGALLSATVIIVYLFSIVIRKLTTAVFGKDAKTVAPSKKNK